MSSDDGRGPPSPRDGSGDDGPVARLWDARTEVPATVREAAVAAAIVAAVGLVLFGISGVWPPMVAVESSSMEPNMYRGDLVVISEPGRYVPAADTRGETGVVTAAQASEVGYNTFGGPGSVVVYQPNGRAGTPVIHRAQFWVDEGENWYERADPEHVNGDSCEAVRNCPAPHAGFITKGDDNGDYDQVSAISDPVRPEWVVGVAHVRVPFLGHVRLWLSASSVTVSPTGVAG
jgi:signal peptidase